MARDILHLIKLSVGTSSIEDLKLWHDSRPDPLCHVTRMWPKRADEILPNGSIYWVIKGEIQARQRILGFDERIGDDGIRRCAILLSRALIPTYRVPRKAFQGWRYFLDADAPQDKPEGDGIPSEIADNLSHFGVY